MRLLYVNACISQRENDSRTLKLADYFLEKYKKINTEDEILIHDIRNMYLEPFNTEMLNYRDSLAAEGNFSEEIHDLARDFASADKIIIAAPYWDLTFPSKLKIYFEYIFAFGLTFSFKDGWFDGLCKADKLIYISTSGWNVQGFDLGSDYIKAVGENLGIKEFDKILVEGFDIDGMDEGELLSKGKKEIDKKVIDF